MSTLATQQQALLEALLAWPADDAMQKIAAHAIDPRARGLKAYQANGHALAERALQAAYPVVAQLLGDESFADLARALWHAAAAGARRHRVLGRVAGGVGADQHAAAGRALSARRGAGRVGPAPVRGCAGPAGGPGDAGVADHGRSGAVAPGTGAGLCRGAQCLAGRQHPGRPPGGQPQPGGGRRAPACRSGTGRSGVACRLAPPCAAGAGR